MFAVGEVAAVAFVPRGEAVDCRRHGGASPATTSDIGGQLKCDFRYSIGIVYNTFPTPPGFTSASSQNFPDLEAAAQDVLDARSSHPGATFENLYDPIGETAMPDRKQLDRASHSATQTADLARALNPADNCDL